MSVAYCHQELSSGALGLKPHNSPWYQPGWGEDLAGYWPRCRNAPFACSVTSQTLPSPSRLAPLLPAPSLPSPIPSLHTTPLHFAHSSPCPSLAVPPNKLAPLRRRFEAKWRARKGGDEMGPGLPDEAFAIGKAIVDNFSWIQDELSSKPHTFNHGDVKPPNMFMMPGDVRTLPQSPCPCPIILSSATFLILPSPLRRPRFHPRRSLASFRASVPLHSPSGSPIASGKGNSNLSTTYLSSRCPHSSIGNTRQWARGARILSSFSSKATTSPSADGSSQS